MPRPTEPRTDGNLEARIRGELPHLTPAELGELAQAVERLIKAFEPERIYVFGSHARRTPHTDSDIDLLILIGASDEPPYKRAQHAYATVGPHSVPLDIQVMTRKEFETRLPVVASLAATVEREGRTLYAASGAA
jgi:uncharacterized protein